MAFRVPRPQNTRVPRYRLAGVRAPAPKSVDLATVALLLGVAPEMLSDLVLVRRSLDARQKPLLVWDLAVEFTSKEAVSLPPGTPLRLTPAEEPPPAPALLLPELDTKAKVAIVGTGPAGLFAALALVDAGVPVTILERGDPAEDRYRKVMKFWTSGVFDPESNVQFGEGGAGTFSDGKLTCGKKHDKVKVVLETLHRFGAPASILVDAKPHIGTDRLVVVLRNVRKHLLEHAATLRYRAKVTGLVKKGDGSLAALVLESGEEVPADVAILALGHSARDTMDMLLACGVAMTRKHFAMGVRIEHPQDAVDLIQYAQVSTSCGVQPADYKQAHVASNGRGIYTFCMCPGGEVIACSSEEGGVVTNGMSRYKRSSGYANAGIVVQTKDEDFDALPGPALLRGRELQRRVEKAAFAAAGGTYAAPALRVTDFLKSRARPISPRPLPKTTYGPWVTAVAFDGILPEPYLDALAEGLQAFDRKMPGFVSDEAVLFAPESRTSSPVRIERDGWCESPSVRGLYPAGEGAGFAGGIVSAALDGLRVARHVRAKLAGERLEAEKATIFKGPEY
jgi:uncharacterized FAD-dependent dehydrogenase